MREIYGVKFNRRFLPDGNIQWQGYWLETPVAEADFMMIPLKIELKEEKERIIITFDNKNQHIIGYMPDVELFTREKIKKVKEDAKETTD
jgi:hypothetical protein